jgi:hypothetical protein
MAFPKNGVIPAPKIQPSGSGLLAVAKPENSANEDMWIRGFAQEWETTVNFLTNWDDTDTTFDVLVDDATVDYYTDIKPWFIEVEENLSTLGFKGIDRLARITRQIEAMSQVAMEAELWDGVIRKGETHDNLALSDSGATILNSGTALSARRALALLEFEAGAVSHAGENGVIHMTRDVFSLLSSQGDVFMFNEDEERVETTNGTPVIIGSGYSGEGPDEATGATATATNKWMYATGTVKTYLGNVDVVNDNLAQAYDVSGNQNDMKLKAIRPAAVYFDPSIHLAVRVDLSV